MRTSIRILEQTYVSKIGNEAKLNGAISASDGIEHAQIRVLVVYYHVDWDFYTSCEPLIIMQSSDSCHQTQYAVSRLNWCAGNFVSKAVVCCRCASIITPVL